MSHDLHVSPILHDLSSSQVPSEEVERVALTEIPSPTSFHQQIREFTYYPGNVSEANTVMVGGNKLRKDLAWFKGSSL